MRKTVLVQAIACALISGAAHAAVKVEDKTFNTAANMLAYTEFELSGEPLAEALGLDLDVLDANRADEPTPFDFAAGIESYEYSEEAMYALNYQSGMGPHLVNGPQNLARGGTMASLGQRVLASNARTNLLHTGFSACDSYANGLQAMAQVQCPVLFALGEQDQMTPPKAAQGLVEAARATGQPVQVCMLPMGHNQMTESPDATLFALHDFLNAATR